MSSVAYVRITLISLGFIITQQCCAAPISLHKEKYAFSKLFEVRKPNDSPAVSVESGASAACEACKFFSGLLQAFLEQGRPEEGVAELAKAICIIAKIEDKRVCDQVIEEFKDEILTVVYSIALGRAKLLCAILLGPSCQPSYNPKNQTLWKIPIPGNKPPVQPIPDPKVRHCSHLIC